MVTRVLLLAQIVFAIGSPAAAQDTVPLTPGTRLRLTLSAPARVEFARFQALTDTALLVAASAAPRVIPLTSIRVLEYSRGYAPSLAGGALGLLLGGAIGATIGCAANRDSYGVFCAGQSDTKVAVGTAIGGIAGAALGAYGLRREKWTRLALPLPSRDWVPVPTRATPKMVRKVGSQPYRRS
ncbi:MAG TPA: hypothetical protein VK864_00255 [Longimicrobiales bacterium]|nr:hypothetical protein [Longimicrobiales bacterium]